MTRKHMRGQEMFFKVCLECGKPKDVDQFSRRHARCKECMRLYSRQQRKENPMMQRQRHRLSRYGITPEQYEAQYELQAGCCAACLMPMEEDVCIDHCHRTGRVRALLHRKCNIALGWLKEDPCVIQRFHMYAVACEDIHAGFEPRHALMMRTS